MWFSWLFWWIAALYLLFFLCVCVSWGFFLDTRFFSTNSTRISFWRRGATNHQVRCDVFPRWDQKIFRRIAIPKRNMFPGGCRYFYNTYFFWSPTFISMLGLLSLSLCIYLKMYYIIYTHCICLWIYIYVCMDMRVGVMFSFITPNYPLGWARHILFCAKMHMGQKPVANSQGDPRRR